LNDEGAVASTGAGSSKSGDMVASSATTDSRLAALCAQKAQQAFLDYRERFQLITRRARERFLARDFAGTYADAAERLHLMERQPGYDEMKI
jgi:isocitrate dehydrogenase kinase/phosphatase